MENLIKVSFIVNKRAKFRINCYRPSFDSEIASTIGELRALIRAHCSIRRRRSRGSDSLGRAHLPLDHLVAIKIINSLGEVRSADFWLAKIQTLSAIGAAELMIVRDLDTQKPMKLLSCARWMYGGSNKF